MDVVFDDKTLDRLETDERFHAGFSAEIVQKFRVRMQMIRAAEDERTFYELKSLHYEKLKGERAHQRSLRLNKQWRLVVEIKEAKPKNIVHIKAIEDYHD